MTPTHRLIAVALACAALAGCSPHAGAPTSRTSAVGFINPVYAHDFPDPAALHVGRTFVVYATQGGGHNIQTATSTDLVRWTPGPDALPALPGWASGDTWAPEVIQVGARYVMFFVAHAADYGRQCIGRAEASSPSGPFRDLGTRPFLCQPGLGGSIDPNVFRGSDGRLFLYWKNDGNCCGRPTNLYGQQLGPDASRLVGQRSTLLGADRSWQGGLIEAPEMLAHGNTYLLFYAANDYASDRYAIGYATCTAPLGPCRNASASPWLATSDAAAGPGHCYPLTLPDGKTWLLFHAWQPDAIGSQSPGRELWLEPITWRGNTPRAAAPSTNSLPRPSVS